MTISGKNKNKFENANIAKLCDKKVRGRWTGKISTNSRWEFFFPEILKLKKMKLN